MNTKSSLRRASLVLVASGVAFSSACVSTELAIRENHPAHTGANTVPLPALRQLGGDTPTVPDADHADHASHAGHDAHADHASQEAEGSPEATQYTCPMHPEIVRSGPGQCPKCGMNLVPKQKSEK